MTYIVHSYTVFTFATQSVLTKIRPSNLRGDFTRSAICQTQVVQVLFCMDKARKRSFTEVALNSVLEENAIDFAWEFC